VPAPSRIRPTLAAALAVASTSLVLLLSACTDSSEPAPAAPVTPSSSSSSGSGDQGSSGHGSGGSGHLTTHPTHPTTTPPTSGHYDPNKCPPGLLCSPSSGSSGS
jgi:hypothetical protein